MSAPQMMISIAAMGDPQDEEAVQDFVTAINQVLQEKFGEEAAVIEVPVDSMGDAMKSAILEIVGDNDKTDGDTTVDEIAFKGILKLVEDFGLGEIESKLDSFSVHEHAKVDKQLLELRHKLNLEFLWPGIHKTGSGECRWIGLDPEDWHSTPVFQVRDGNGEVRSFQGAEVPPVFWPEGEKYDKKRASLMN